MVSGPGGGVAVGGRGRRGFRPGGIGAGSGSFAPVIKQRTARPGSFLRLLVVIRFISWSEDQIFRRLASGFVETSALSFRFPFSNQFRYSLQVQVRTVRYRLAPGKTGILQACRPHMDTVLCTTVGVLSVQLVSLMRLQAAGMHPIHGWWCGRALWEDVGAVLGLVWLLVSVGLPHLWGMLCWCGYFPRRGLSREGFAFPGVLGSSCVGISRLFPGGVVLWVFNVRGRVSLLLVIFLEPSLLSVGDMFRRPSGTSNETK